MFGERDRFIERETGSSRETDFRGHLSLTLMQTGG